MSDEVLIPLLGAWGDAKSINFSNLPSRFVLKATHGSGWNIIVKEKNCLNLGRTRRQLQAWLNTDYAYCAGYEFHYHYCTPRIIAEQYLEPNECDDLIDYKVYCFNAGDPIILVCCDRHSGNSTKEAYYDAGWHRLDIKEAGHEGFDCARPQHLEDMLRYSKTLSEGFALVRVDWYETSGKLYFGEMTFTPAGGAKHFIPEEWNAEFGRRIDLEDLPTWFHLKKFRPE